MPAAAKPMGMIMDVTVSCARGKGGRRSGGSVCVFCETRGGKFSRAQRQAEHASDEPWARSEHEGFSFPSLP